MIPRPPEAKDPQHRVLITYAWVRSSYAVLRDLAENGVQVWVADCHRTGMGQSSRLRAGFVYTPPPYEDERAFVRAVGDACRELGIGLVFPSHNETEVLAAHRDLLPPGTDRLIPKAEHCALFNNKADTYTLAQSLGLRVPRRLEYRDPSELPALVRDLKDPSVVIKLRTGNSARGVEYASTGEEAQRRVERMILRYELPPNRLPQVEERVQGDGAGCSVLYWEGARIASFCHRRLRERLATGGTSTLRECIESPELERAAFRIFDQVGWHGLAMAEFKLAADGGEPWFIEVNPRLWGSLPLAIGAGIEFPYLLWSCAVDGPEVARRRFQLSALRSGWKGRWLLGDLMVGASQLVRLHPIQAMRTLFGTRADEWDDLHSDDVRAFMGQLVRYGIRMFAAGSNIRAREGALR